MFSYNVLPTMSVIDFILIRDCVFINGLRKERKYFYHMIVTQLVMGSPRAHVVEDKSHNMIEKIFR